MEFSYNKPLSIEEVFSKYDTDHNGEIDKNEAKEAKNIKIFDGFNVKKGMTIDVFEKKNREVYAQYEQAATEAYSQHMKKARQWVKLTLEEIEEEIEEEINRDREKVHRILELQRLAKKDGVPFTPEELMNENEDDLFIMYKVRKNTKQMVEYEKLIDQAKKLGISEDTARKMSEAKLKDEISKRLMFAL